MVKPIVRDAEIVFLIAKSELFRVLIAPSVRRKIVIARSWVQIGNRHIGESHVEEGLPVEITSADNQHLHLPTKNALADQPFQGARVEITDFFVLWVLPSCLAHLPKRIRPPKN